jgi:hypothetical protein
MLIEFWLLIVAVIFTAFGYYVGLKEKLKISVDEIVATTVDSLIRDGYLKTRGSGSTIEILKINDQAD